MKKVVIYLAILIVLTASIIIFSGFEWYGKEAKDIKQGEQILEEITQNDVIYKGEVNGIEAYNYVDDNRNYIIDKNDGSVIGYLNENAKNENKSAPNINKDQAIDIANQEVLKYCPSFLDMNIEYIVKNDKEDDFFIYMYQLSAKSRRTGNNAHIRLLPNGVVYTLAIYDNEDPTIVDKDPLISETKAIVLAYSGAKKHMLEVKQEQIAQQESVDSTQLKPTVDEIIYNDQGEPIINNENEYIPLEVYLDNQDGHELNVVLSVHKSRQIWKIDISNVETNQYENVMGMEDHKMILLIIIDANTGEVIEVAYSG